MSAGALDGLDINLDTAAAHAMFEAAKPFAHCVLDNFLDPEIASAVEQDFPYYDSKRWVVYDSAIENKKALNEWGAFTQPAYTLFTKLCSPYFVQLLSDLAGCVLYPDYGLHGGGFHIHGPGGNLNPHLDYSLHPRLCRRQRKLNLIIYLSHDLREEHGGHLGLWEHDAAADRPGRLAAEIAPRFNRAVIFDTSRNSWHGMSRPLRMPAGVYRRSVAVYYLCDAEPGADARGRARFVPRASQMGDAAVLRLCEERAIILQAAQADGGDPIQVGCGVE